MQRVILIVIFFAMISCEKKSKPPNIIYILADDLGYGELGAYGQEIIETPNIDALAKNGMLFTQHYSGSPVCAPSRSVLLTGMHTGHSYIRGNDEWKERGNVWDYEAVFHDRNLEGQRPLLDSINTFAEIIQNNGYKTAFIGKWGLGAPDTEGVPNNQGFHYFFGYNCQRQAHTLYPTHLWENEKKIILNNKLIAPHSNLEIGSNPNNSNSYINFSLNEYAPELMHRKAVEFIESNTDNSFFLLYASPLPHVPLQAPIKWVNYYRKKLGSEQPYIGKSYFPSQSPRATYAAMISTLYEQVGHLVALLSEKNILDNTLIIFTSDNGPTYTGGVDGNFFNSAKPFKAEYGWAKGFLHEGGIRVPMIASWKNHIKKGSVSDHLSGFQDVFLTVLELAGIHHPVETDGISFVNTLMGLEQKEKHKYLYWEIPEYGGQQAVRMGAFKAIRKNIFKNNLSIELFNLATDIQETINVADQYPKIIEKAERIMKKEHRKSVLSRFRFPAFGE